MNNSYYDSKNHFNGIQFDRLTPLLSCELNELQEILQHKIEDYIRDTSMSCIYSQLEMTVANGTLTFDKDIVSYLNGIRFFVPSTHVDLSALADGDHAIVFMEAWKEVASRDSALTEYGGEGLSAVTNNIKPPYSDNDITSERVVWKWRLRVEKFDVSKKYNTGNDKFPYLGYDSSTVFSPMYARGGGIFAIPATISGEEVFRPANGSYKKFSEDTNLWIAGDATTEFKELFNSEDGFVYALPLVRLSAHLDTSNSLVLDVAQESTTEGISKINEQIEDIFTQLNQVAIQGKQYTDAQIQLVTATGIPKLVSYPYKVFATVDGQTKFDIPYEQFNSATDTLLVARNGSDITNDKNDHSKDLYTVTDPVEANGVITKGFVTLNTGISAGSFLGLKILNNVPIGTEGSISGRVVAKGSLPQDRIEGIDAVLSEIHDNTKSIHIPMTTEGVVASSDYIDFSSDEEKLICVDVQGKLTINHLGKDGNCEDLSRWLAYQSTLSLDSGLRALGASSIKVTSTVAGMSLMYKNNFWGNVAQPNSYYCVSALVRNGNMGNPIGVYNGGSNTGVTIGKSVTSSDATKWCRIWALISTGASVNCDIDFGGVATAVGQYFNIDAITVEQISVDQFNDPNYKPTGYVDGDQSVGESQLSMITRGKNLFDISKLSISSPNNSQVLVDINEDTNVVTVSKYVGSLAFPYEFITVKPNTQYTISGLINNTSKLAVRAGNLMASVFTPDLALTTESSSPVLVSGTFTTDEFGRIEVMLMSKADTDVVAGMQFSQVQVEEGTVATEYEKFKQTYFSFNKPLRSLPNGVKDEIKNGKFIKRIGKYVLDGTLSWGMLAKQTGYTQVVANLPYPYLQDFNFDYTTTQYPTGAMFVKNNNKILPRTVSGASDAGWIIGENVNQVRLSIPKSDCGWDDSYTPTVDEIKAYFYGWKMYDGTNGIYSSGTKYWIAINEWGLGATTKTSTLPTAPATYGGYNPYRVYYQLHKPQVVDLPLAKLIAYKGGDLLAEYNDWLVLVRPSKITCKTFDNLRANLNAIMHEVVNSKRYMKDSVLNIEDYYGRDAMNPDDFIKTGMFRGNWTSYPSGAQDSQGLLIVYAYLDGWVHQVFITPHENKIWSRQRTSYQWTPWVADVGSPVDVSSQISYNSGYSPSGGLNKLTKDANNQVNFNFQFVTANTLTAGTEYLVGTLPVGYRPSSTVSLVFRCSNNTIHSGWITSDGVFHVMTGTSSPGAGSAYGGSVTFAL